jgi:hypothetical protein
MAKKHHQPGPHDQREDSADPLGGLMKTYTMSLVGLLVVSGAVALVGLGLVGCGLVLAQQLTSVILLLIGTCALLAAVALLGVNVFNVGRRLEMRKKGLRYVEAGIVTEIRWEDVVDIQVNRTDDTNLGVATVRKRGGHYAAPSGPLTRTEWDVTIRARDGRSMHLGPRFLKLVPDVGKLISQMRIRSGV